MITEELRAELEFMQEFCNVTVGDNPEELLCRLSELQAYMSRSGYIWVQAKKHLREVKFNRISTEIIEIAKVCDLSKAVQNALLNNLCSDETEFCEWAERINRTCTHQLEAVRSQLSYLREERKKTC